MDTSEYPSLPNLAQMHARLAINNLRVLDVVEGQLPSMERLLNASLSRDWPLVEKICQSLAAHSSQDQELQQVAQKVCDELKHGPFGSKGPLSLAQLLDQCRTIQEPSQ